ncbi:MAG: glycosyltransferase family 2 protein [Chloroflexota bacterium]|jgi:glycosyltransferase involved in cell wall biosynthesis|nr:glycosyltransferase family 2 protein [Chloroflexota bacterium]MDP6758434.1 glycosyltransferase family 2 protein [Chloroflexota bacterium]
MNSQVELPSLPRRSERISAFFPCYNDAHTIADIVRAADATLADLTDDYEVIVVNDGSFDGSAEVLAGLVETVPALKVVTHPANRGYGGALQSGFAAATGDLIFYTDGDGQYDPRELKLLIAELADGVDVVNGYKISRSDSPVRRILGSAYNFVATTLLQIPMRDLDCDFRLFRREVAQELRITSSGGIICAQMMQQVYRGRYTVREVPVTHLPRRHGSSQFFQPWNVFSLGIDLLRLWWGGLFGGTGGAVAETGAAGEARDAESDPVAEADHAID